MVATTKGQQLRLGEDTAAPKLLCPLLDLPEELLVAVATQLAEDDELAASFARRKLREAVAGTERRKEGAGLSTTIGSAFEHGQVPTLSCVSAGTPVPRTAIRARPLQQGQMAPLSLA
jgi:hypothetical protein